MAFEKFITLSLADYTTLSTTGTVTINGTTLTYQPDKVLYLVPDEAGVTLNTTTGSESISDGTNTLNVVTRDTTQEISGAKTFVNADGITIKSSASSTTSSFKNSGTSTQISHNGSVKFAFGGSSNYTYANLLPSGSVSIGASGNEFSNAYVDVTNSNKLNLIDPNGTSVSESAVSRVAGASTVRITTAGTTTFQFATSGNDSFFNLYPHTSGKTLGLTTNVWDTTYTNNISDGTNTVTVAQVAQAVGGLTGTYRHRIDIECAGEDLQINVNLNTNTSITTLALLDSIKNNLLGLPIVLDAQGSYRLVTLNDITVNAGAGTATFEIWDDVGQFVHTYTWIDFYQDTIYQL